MSSIKCIEVEDEDEQLTATNLGIICSFYYLKVETLAIFLRKVSESMKLKDIIELVSQAEELANFQFKPK